jgi:hypothetical protein
MACKHVWKVELKIWGWKIALFIVFADFYGIYDDESFEYKFKLRRKYEIV